MTVTPVERNYRPALKAERRRQEVYHDQAKNAEMWLTMKYGGDWLGKLSTEVPDPTGGLGPKPAAPELTQEQKDALLQEAQARFAGMEPDDDALNNLYDVAKGTSRAALSVLDTGVDWVRNMATQAAVDAYNLGKNPNWHTFGEAAKDAILPITRWGDSAYNTTLWTQIETALTQGFDQGFGEAGTGSGFYIGIDSPVQQEKNRRAYEFAALENGEAASLGRLTAEAIGLGKGTSPYSVTSGLIDAAAILAFDPLNLITGGTAAATKAGKATQLLKQFNIDPKQVELAARFIDAGGDLEEDAALIDKVMRGRTKARLVEENQDLTRPRPEWQDEEIRRAAEQAARDNEFTVGHRNDIDDWRQLESDLDTLIKTANAATDDVVLRELEVGPIGATLREAEEQAARMGADTSLGEDAVQAEARANADRVGADFDMAEQKAIGGADEAAADGAEVTLGELPPEKPPIRAKAERLDDPEDLFAQAARAAEEASLREHEAANAFFQSEAELMDALRAAGRNVEGIDASDYKAMLKAFAGFSDNGVNVRQFVRSYMGGDFDNVAKLVARVTDPADLYDLFPEWGVDTLRVLARTTDEHQAYLALLNGALKGDITKAGSKVARWTVRHGQSGAKGSSFARRVVRMSRDGVPNASMASFTDPDAMAKLVSDFITEGASMAYRKTKNLGQWEDFRRFYLREIIDAPDEVSRKRVWIQMQQDFLDLVPGWNKLTNEVQSEWRALLGQKLGHQQSKEARTAFIRAEMESVGKKSEIFGLANDPHTFDEAYEGLITSLVDLADNVSMLNPKVLRKLFHVIDEAGNMSLKGKSVNAATMVNDAFDEYLRPLYLAFRPGYATLQVVDSGMRALLTGHTNLLTSPLQTIAIAAHLTLNEDSKLIKLLDRIIGSAPKNADGTPLFGEAQVTALQATLDDVQDTVIGQYLLRHQFRDVFTGDDGAVTHLLDLGWKTLQPGDEGFHVGWVDTMLLHMTPARNGDDMFQDVFEVMRTGAAPQRVQDWAASVGKGGMSAQDMVTDFYFSGPGRDAFNKLIASAQTRYTKVPLMQEVANDPAKIAMFLWDQSEAGSLRNLVDALTARGNTELMQMFQEAADARGSYLKYLSTLSPTQMKKSKRGHGKAFVREITLPGGRKARVDLGKKGALEKVLRSVVRQVDDADAPLTVRYRAKAANPRGARGLKDVWNEALAGFFTAAGALEKRLGQAPVIRDDVLMESAKRALFLSPTDAKTLEAQILSQLPKYKRTTKQREIVAVLRENVRNAQGKGLYTLEDVTRASQNAAYRRVSDLMYGVRGRNASAQRFAILFPFMQSWVNASRVYLMQTVRNPKRAANALRLLQTANSPESGVVYDIMPGVNRDDDPAKPLFWTDDMGNRQVSIPMLGYGTHLVDSALAKVFGGEANPNWQPYLNLRVDRWNPMNFGEPLPGVGPAITVPARAIDNVTPIQQDLKKWVLAMEPTDSTQKKDFLEANMPWWLKAVFPTDEDIAAQKGNAMAALIANNPEKYLDADGFVKEDALAELTRDSEELAKGLVRGNLWRAALFRGGTSTARTVKDSSGQVIPLGTLSQEFDQVVEESGSIQAGYAFLVDKYGPQGLSFLVGNRNSVAVANDEGYEFAKENPELFDQTYDVLGYFFPASDISGDPVMRLRSPEYQRMLTEAGKNRMKTPEEWASDYNRLLKGVRDLRLEQKFINGEITETQYEAEKNVIAKEYGIAVQTGFNTSHREKIHLQLKTALNNPTLAATPTGQALQQYLTTYDAVKATAEGGSLTGEGDAQRRAYLLQEGERLCQSVPEFIPVWRGQLLWEVDK